MATFLPLSVLERLPCAPLRAVVLPAAVAVLAGRPRRPVARPAARHQPVLLHQGANVFDRSGALFFLNFFNFSIERNLFCQQILKSSHKNSLTATQY
jgi:hypothetical protein